MVSHKYQLVSVVRPRRPTSSIRRQWSDPEDPDESRWTESAATGNKVFVEETKERLGLRAKGHNVEEFDGVHVLRERGEHYHFAGKNGILRTDNS
jgi:hypothetical protein